MARHEDDAEGFEPIPKKRWRSAANAVNNGRQKRVQNTAQYLYKKHSRRQGR